MYTLETHKKYSYVKIVKIPRDDIKKIDFALCNQPTETPDAYYKRQNIKPDIICNGGFFSMADGTTCFGFRDEGVSRTIATYSGVGITGDKDLSYGQNLQQSSGLRDFISAYPNLVEYGNKINPTYAKEIDYKARRTAFGWNDDYVFIVTVDSPGLRFSLLADIFLELKAQFAINLDGGGSTRLLVEGKRKTSLTSARAVDNVVCIYLNKKTEDKQTTNTAGNYTVQVATFFSNSRAQTLLTQLKRKGFTDAYTQKVGIYHVVRVGSFSTKLNAQRRLDNLKAAGYKPLIIKK